MEGRTTSKILPLESYQGRRAERFARAKALHAPDPVRSDVVRHLGAALDAVRADRGAVVWIEDAGSTLVHPYCVLDLGSDTPRRDTPLQPLRRAWKQGTASYIYVPPPFRVSPGQVSQERAHGYSAVALGLDDVRVYFLIIAHRVHESPPDAEQVERLLFHAGECAGRIIHAELDTRAYHDIPMEERPFDIQRRDTFSGWVVLKDLDGVAEPEHDVASKRIGARFMVLRYVRSVVDDALVVPTDAVPQSVETVFDDLPSVPADDEERILSRRVIDACKAGAWKELLGHLMELGNVVDASGHFHGALETHRVAYDLAVHLNESGHAIDASRLCGRALRKIGQLDESEQWYESAAGLAQTVGDDARYASSLSGLANVYRDRGNFRRVRELLQQAIEIATHANVPEPLATSYHTLSNVECELGNLGEGVRCIWQSVLIYPLQRDRDLAMLDLADLLLKAGDTGASETAYKILKDRINAPGGRMLVYAGLARVSAIRGDVDEFITRTARLEAERLSQGEGSPWVWAQIAIEHAEAFHMLGDIENASKWLEDGRRVVEKHGFGKLKFELERVEELLESVESRSDFEPPPNISDQRFEDVRRGLERAYAELSEA